MSLKVTGGGTVENTLSVDSSNNLKYNTKTVAMTDSNISGNATTATSAGRLTYARKTYVTLGTASTTTTRDWSGDTTIPVSGTLAVANGGTGTTSLSNITVGNSSKLGGYRVQTSFIGGSSTETTNYWTYVTKSKFTSNGGYIKYSNGLIIQWGNIASSFDTIFQMPVSFSNMNNYFVTASSIESDRSYKIQKLYKTI